MATTTYTQHSVSVGSAQHTETSIWEKAESSRYGLNMLILALTLIPGGMATPYAVAMGDIQFALVLFPSVFSLILVMGLAPIKMIVYTSAFALAMNLIMFLAGALG